VNEANAAALSPALAISQVKEVLSQPLVAVHA